MEPTKPDNNENDDAFFFDALDDLPFYDCALAGNSDQSASSSSALSLSEHVTRTHFDPPKPSHEIPSLTSSLRRRSSRRGISGEDPEASVSDSPANTRERRYRVYRNLNDDGMSELTPGRLSSVPVPRTGDNERVGDSGDSESAQHRPNFNRVRINEDSSITTANNDRVSDSVDSDPMLSQFSSVRVPIDGQNNEQSTVTTVSDVRVSELADSAAEIGDSSSNLLVFIAGLLIKAIGFQINLIISFVTFPIWFIYCSYLFITDPFGALTRGRDYLIGKFLRIWNLIIMSISPIIYEWFKDHKSIWKLALQCGCGLFWSIYVCFVLCGLLVSSVVVSGFFMRILLEEPIQMREALKFDYTKSSPIAYVPINSCDSAGCGVKCKNMGNDGRNVGLRVIPPNHKLQVTVLLALPESEYNRHLGVFQVRVDFLSANGDILASSSHPCMLKFKSEPIRLLLTFLKIAPLVAGYVSESQTLNLRIRGLTEGYVPTACLKVIMEQRAEYRPGAGVPEIYDASLILESELPFFKRIMWYWRKTIFIWISTISFIMELFCTLVCCRPIIIPRSRPRDSINNATQNNGSA